jgi:hypothetical protein
MGTGNLNLDYGASFSWELEGNTKNKNMMAMNYPLNLLTSIVTNLIKNIYQRKNVSDYYNNPSFKRKQEGKKKNYNSPTSGSS